ncbi:N-methylhydantoinase B [Rhizobiales bacterium GAS188]|nr:N-methylhydantoinase B [Rhizobiales bacterium GAS188]
MTDLSGLSELRKQIMWNRLIAIVEEQAQTLLRTAFSQIVRECGDLSAGVFDLRGRMLAQAVTGTPGHINSMAASVSHFIAAFPLPTMREGDVYITNDPWLGTGHRNDFVVTTPVFHRGSLVAIFSCTSHLTDIGGIGFGPDATDLFMEALGIPFLKLFDRGVLNETLMAMVKENTRLPVECEGDIYSLANCNEIGARRLVEMLDEFGLDGIEGLADHVVDSSRQAVLNAIAKLPKGSWRNTMTVDGYDAPVTLAATLTIAEGAITVDYQGTSPQARHGINVPLSYSTAYTVFGLASALVPDVPNNAGSLSPYTVAAPPGSILNALRPAAVMSRHIIGQMLPDVVFGCLRQAMPNKVPAEGTSCLWNLIFQGYDPTTGGQFVSTVVTNGGTGARPTKDGLSATAYPSGVRGSPIEVVEATTPLLFWKKEFRANSGGAGRYRGGHGLEIEIENRSGRDMTLQAAFDRIAHPARGRDGGADGERGALSLKSSGVKLKGKGAQQIPAGERLLVRTPGGGGLGAPSARDRLLVERDLRDGTVTAAGITDAYKIALPAAE